MEVDIVEETTLRARRVPQDLASGAGPFLRQAASITNPHIVPIVGLPAPG